jgi:hypothetical protein
MLAVSLSLLPLLLFTLSDFSAGASTLSDSTLMAQMIATIAPEA